MAARVNAAVTGWILPILFLLSAGWHGAVMICVHPGPYIMPYTEGSFAQPRNYSFELYGRNCVHTPDKAVSSCYQGPPEPRKLARDEMA